MHYIHVSKPQKAVKVWKIAADGGSGVAQYGTLVLLIPYLFSSLMSMISSFQGLARCYYEGAGVTQDFLIALKYFDMSEKHPLNLDLSSDNTFTNLLGVARDQGNEEKSHAEHFS